MNECPVKRDHFKRKGSFSKHHFFRGKLRVFGGVYTVYLNRVPKLMYVFFEIMGIKKELQKSIRKSLGGWTVGFVSFLFTKLNIC